MPAFPSTSPYALYLQFPHPNLVEPGQAPPPSTEPSLRDPPRLNAIRSLETVRGSRIIVYITGDRQGLETQIAFDQIGPIYDHLVRLGRQARIDLFLYSPGGLTLAGFAIVNLIREFCQNFSVLVPFKALSCATLISLGADEIVMSRLAQLSPIDPSVTSPFNPPAPVPPQPGALNLLPLSVEDVNAYINLAKQEFGLKNEESMMHALELLASKVHPLALGSVQRSREQIQMLAKKLMFSHVPPARRKAAVRTINTLTRQLGSHDYIISRKEAKEQLGLPVVYPTPTIENDMWALFRQYENLMELRTPYNPDFLLGAAPEATREFHRAVIESEATTHVFTTRQRIRRVQMVQQGVPTPGFQTENLFEGWIEYT